MGVGGNTEEEGEGQRAGDEDKGGEGESERGRRGSVRVKKHPGRAGNLEELVN